MQREWQRQPTNPEDLTPLASPGEPPIQSSLSDTRQVINLADPQENLDFVTLHNIVYFMYTGLVNLHEPYEGQGNVSLPAGYPAEADAYRLYCSADKFPMRSLTKRAYAHLKHGLTPETVSERLFQNDVEHHDELKTLFVDYILQNWDEVKVTEGWKRAHSDDGGYYEDDPTYLKSLRYRHQLLFEISRQLYSQASELPTFSRGRDANDMVGRGRTFFPHVMPEQM